MNDKDFAALIYERYESGIEYQNSLGLRRLIPEYVRFYEGKQWPEPTRNTRNLPRPVINIVKMICRNKKSAILSTPVRILYKSKDKRVDTDTLNAFSDTVLKDLDQDALDKNAIDDATKKGSYFYHYYWDSEGESAYGLKDGALRCELIDPLNIFFENPCQLDEQKQGWIIISTRDKVENVIKNAEEGVDKTQILPDEELGASNPSKEMCTVLTMYYKKENQVFCVRSVKNTVIKREFPISPNKNLAYEALGVEKNSKRTENFATLYPIVCGYYEKRDRCIYGLSEVEGLIPNQKAINFNIAMSLLNAQEVAWGKYIALPGALKGQTITNAPGQILVDYTGTGNGIKKMQESYMQSYPVELIKTITDLTRSVTGTSEFMTGEVEGAGMSGTAIARLQSQALLPIEDLRATFMAVKRKQGRVLAQFYKLYFPKCTFEYSSEENKSIIAHFNPDDYDGKDLEIIVETVLGANASVAGDITMLDNLLKSGKISLEAYIGAYPDSALTDKKKLLARIKESKEAEAISYKEEIKRLEAQLKENESTVSRVSAIISENKSLKEIIAKEYSNGRK
ncbi:MAG: hypothetical protein IJV68_02040 [Clostridia bacterium]|nr:hypothetical protein [Clostridia bacterium]